MTKMTKTNISALARKHGVSRRSLTSWQMEEGLDLADDNAVAARVAEVAGKAGADLDIKAARLRKLTAEANRIETENRVRSGDLISRAQAQQSAMTVASTARARLLQTANTLPPRLAGLDEAKIQAILRAEFIEILTDLSNPQSYIKAG